MIDGYQNFIPIFVCRPIHGNLSKFLQTEDRAGCGRNRCRDPGGGGGTIIFSAYIGSDPASTVHPKKYQEFQALQKIFEI